MRVMTGHTRHKNFLLSVIISKHSWHGDLPQCIDLAAEFGHCFLGETGGYIAGSLGPAGSQIRKLKSWITFFLLRSWRGAYNIQICQSGKKYWADCANKTRFIRQLVFVFYTIKARDRHVGSRDSKHSTCIVLHCDRRYNPLALL